MSTLLLTLALTGTAHAQAAPATAAPDPLVAALDLPEMAEGLRKQGVSDTDVKEALAAAREKKLSAAEAAETIRASGEAVGQHGVPAGFGAFVRSQLEAGKRGPDLVAAIKAECEARGVPVPPRGEGARPGSPPPGANPDGTPPHGAPPAGGGPNKNLPPGAPEGAAPPPGKPPGAPEGAPDHPENGKGAKTPPPKGK